MKIIGKIKDYFHHLVYQYGEDEKIILDTRDNQQPSLFGDSTFKLYLCGIIYEGVKIKDKVYWAEQIFEISKKQKLWDFRTQLYNQVYVEGFNHSFCIEPYLDKDNLNQKMNCPIIVMQYGSYYKFPILQDIGFNKYMSAQDIYLKLIEYLSPKDLESTSLTNKEKIVSKGFDLKTSFRK